jgi:hypothetical protein
MDIHKPKPWQGWPEFLKEIGTIVIGVLIALGAEQAVEWVHWRHEVEAERGSLLNEARNNLGAVAYRRTESACIGRRLADLEEIFRRQEQGRPLAIRAPLTTPPLDIESTSSWEIAVSGQALGHMPRKEKLSFSNAFDTYRAFNLLRNEEDAIWRRLQLVNHPDVLSPGDWVGLHQAFGEAEATNSRMASLTSYVIRGARVGQRPEQVELTPTDIADMKTFCAPLIQ